MAKTINFCGDSYCDYVDPNTSKTSWCVQLAKQLDAKIIGGGKSATAYENAINSFKPSADYTVFCWTESHRLYHKNYACTYTSGISHFKTKKTNELLSVCAEMFYRYFYEAEYFNELQMRSLYWFDHEVLSKYTGTILHFWNFDKTYTFKYGIEYPDILSSFRDDSSPSNLNHLTPEQNERVANKAFQLIRRTYG